MEENKRYYSLDALKGICALLVVLFHVPIPGKVGQIVILFAKCAVPIFFMISGYFLGKKHDTEKILISIKKQLLKIIKLALCALALYLIFCLVLSYKDIAGYLNSFFGINGLIRLFVFNEPIAGGHLWYLFAYIYALIILYWIVKYKKEKYMYIYSIIGLVVYLTFGKYSNIFFGREFNYLYIRNFLFDALPYVSIGYYLANKDLSRIKNSKLMCVIIISTVALILEYTLLNYFNVNTVYNNYLFDTSLAISVLILCINNKNIFKDSFLYKLGNKDSLYIYIIHPMINTILNKMFAIVGATSIYSKVSWIVVLILSIIISICYNNIKTRIKNK